MGDPPIITTGFNTSRHGHPWQLNDWNHDKTDTSINQIKQSSKITYSNTLESVIHIQISTNQRNVKQLLIYIYIYIHRYMVISHDFSISGPPLPSDPRWFSPRSPRHLLSISVRRPKLRRCPSAARRSIWVSSRPQAPSPIDGHRWS